MTVIKETYKRRDRTAPSLDDVGFVHFTVSERRHVLAGDFVIVQVKVSCRLVNGELTSPDLVAGPALAQIGSAGPTYEIEIPESSTPVRLWPLVDAGMPQPPAGSSGFVRNGGGVTRIQALTQGEYDDLDNPDPATLFIITDSQVTI